MDSSIVKINVSCSPQHPKHSKTEKKLSNEPFKTFCSFLGCFAQRDESIFSFMACHVCAELGMAKQWNKRNDYRLSHSSWEINSSSSSIKGMFTCLLGSLWQEFLRFWQSVCWQTISTIKSSCHFYRHGIFWIRCDEYWSGAWSSCMILCAATVICFCFSDLSVVIFC